MVIVNFTGQLGNQMFQYALGRYLEECGRKVLYYTGYYKQHPEFDFALPGIFNLNLPEASKDQVLACFEDRHRLVDRVRRKLFGRHVRVFSEVDAKTLAYKPEVYLFKRGFIDGYWQSEKYFAPVSHIIRECFSFPEASAQNRALASVMKSEQSVGIHVRRGDYLGGRFPVMDEAYYGPAMRFFTDKYASVHFYVFSNDIPWCRSHLDAGVITYVDWNSGKESPWDMWLMSQCRHNIIANSSFSWWGAWLNTNEGKEVVAPRTWFHHRATPDIYCDNWTII